MDFITYLPPVHGYDSILVVVDRMSKYTICILTSKDITSEAFTQLLLIHLFSKHGFPEHITSNCDSVFISHFMMALGKILDIKLHLTAGYHPEANGQTKRMNQTLEQYLCVYCTYQQDNWDKLLPLAEITLNLAENTSTGVLPYFANKGYHLRFTFSKDVDVALAPACDFAVTLESLLEFLQAQLLNAQETMKKTADQQHADAPDFPLGSQVYVPAEFITT